MNASAVGDNMLIDKVENVNVEKCRRWLERCSVSDGESVCSYETSLSSGLLDTEDGASAVDDIATDLEGFAVGDVVRVNGGTTVDIPGIHPVTQQVGNVYRNVCINKSRKVHLGNVTYINGPVYVQQRIDNLNQIEASNEKDNDQTNVNERWSIVRMMKRINWLAQPPLAALTKMKKPATLVIICHSATDDATTHPDNVLLVRLIQQFHIESRGWDDIGYNFLVGSDGNTYEGRGWGTQGAHTQRFNRISVGICFVGCFMNKLPPRNAIEQAKALIEDGVANGAIDPEYSLVGHRQCIATESPGGTLFEEVRTWPRFDESVNVETATKLLE